MRNPSSSGAPAGRPTPCCSKVGIKRGPWTPEEDELLAKYVKREGEGRWRTLPKKAGLVRCGKSCRLRWMNYLRPSVKHGRINPDEEDLILRLHRLLGNRWSLIAGRIPGRTDNEIKNYWNTHLSKKLISQGLDPRTHKPLNPNYNNPSTSQIQNPNPSLSEFGETSGSTIKQAKPTTSSEYIPATNHDDDENKVVNGATNEVNWHSFDGFVMGSQGHIQGYNNKEEEEDYLMGNYCFNYEDTRFSSLFMDSMMDENGFGNMVAPTSFDPTLHSSSQAFNVHDNGTIWGDQVLSTIGALVDHEGSNNILKDHYHP
ncbi:hypothetical protein HS088_TW23G00455 [Tripterygium wilfordii]|uniref:Transcription repressor MYB5-like n=1 Tax=Tripterygium wilfordii TaxID=458696 RepID=A0A7J7BV71_TRIWF|nr:transcription repressor MYB5-like [Tripterygium wilfordii]KAF5725728.1 hypothetical protein HS088_TW23G00455 [Tripterygium wilfordii]